MIPKINPMIANFSPFSLFFLICLTPLTEKNAAIGPVIMAKEKYPEISPNMKPIMAFLLNFRRIVFISCSI